MGDYTASCQVAAMVSLPQKATGKGAPSALAEQLIDAASAVSPTDDAKGYVQQTLLPVLGPAIEQLLHHVAETGELQRALNANLERDGKPKRRERSKQAMKDEAGGASGDKPSTPGTDSLGYGLDEPEEMGLDPLAWLADYLRQHTRGSAEKYRTNIDQRVAELIERQQKEEAEALAALE